VAPQAAFAKCLVGRFRRPGTGTAPDWGELNSSVRRQGTERELPRFSDDGCRGEGHCALARAARPAVRSGWSCQEPDLVDFSTKPWVSNGCRRRYVSFGFVPCGKSPYCLGVTPGRMMRSDLRYRRPSGRGRWVYRARWARSSRKGWRALADRWHPPAKFQVGRGFPR